MKYKIIILALILMFTFFLSIPSAYADITGSEDEITSDIPRDQSTYNDSHFDSINQILLHRIKEEPFNLYATIIFILAIIHTMMIGFFKNLSHKARDKYKILIENGLVDKDSTSIKAGIYHILSEIEVVFGIWTIALGLIITIFYDWNTFTSYINGLHYNEPLFIIVIMTIASSRPILKFFELAMWKFVKLFGGTLEVWWLTILIIGPLLGSLITEPAAMTISAYILAEKFYRIEPSKKLKYATLALLFVNISIGGSLTNFAAPPILLVAEPWDWSISFMFLTFGWKAIVAILLSTTTYFLLLKKDFEDMHEAFENYKYKKYIQHRFISKKELNDSFDELSLLVSRNTKFFSELNAYGSILKERIKDLAIENLSNEEIVKLDIENAIDEKYESIQLLELQRIVPGLLPEEHRPKYWDLNWDHREDIVPLWVILVHIGFLIWTVANADTPALFLGGFLFYLGFFQVTSFYQNRLDLKPALLVAFFLAGLIIHGTLQSWWISPLIANLPAFGLNITAIVLTAFNDNASITYLSTLVPNLSDKLKYALVSGALTGGGLTVIANAPNPVGQSILKKHFDKGISSVSLLKFALIPTVITGLIFLIL
ncbi:MAG: putative Na+/H+ antiporter [Acidaminobacteraceae bacterium]